MARPMRYITFGELMRSFRKVHGWNQTRLAERAAISRNYLSLIERDKASNMSMCVFVRLARALELEPRVLFGMYLEYGGCPAIEEVETTEEKVLKVWFDGYYWIIAHSPADAVKTLSECTGDSCLLDIDKEEFVLWDDEFTLLCDSAPSDNMLPGGAKTGRHDSDSDSDDIEDVHGGLWWIKASTKAWIEHGGRGILACADW